VDPNTQRWLNEAGYHYHCFISWPHLEDHEIAQCARAVKNAIKTELGYSVPDPKVFLDETEMKPGDVWPEALRNALCKSLAMVAICAPIYYDPSHTWCGLEWAAMELLGDRRLNGETYRAIIPIVLRQRSGVPGPVAKFQYVDFSKTSVQGRHYFSTIEFRKQMGQVVERIEQIAETIARLERRPDCESFAFPTESAFAHLLVPPQKLPFRE